MASVASTYARAFADVVLDARLDANRATGGLRRIVALLAESIELRRVWENPAVPGAQKRRLLDAIVKREGIDRHVRNLVAVLIDHRRFRFWEESPPTWRRNWMLGWDSPRPTSPAPASWMTPKSVPSRPRSRN